MELISKAEAQARGLLRFFTGKPCKRGHTTERYVVEGRCVQCTIERTTRYRVENPEEVAARRARYRAANKEKIAAQSIVYRTQNQHKLKAYREVNRERIGAYMAEWRDVNREKIAALDARYRAENPDACRAAHVRRKAAKKNRHVAWDRELTALVEFEALALAVIRQAETGIEWHADHMYPMRAKKVSGLHVWNNLQVIPAVMNLKKGNRLTLTQPGEWLRR